MVGVASQIVFCIFAAAVIGSVAGYLIGGLRHGRRIAEVERLWKSKLDQRDGELAALRDGIATPAPTTAHESISVNSIGRLEESPVRNVGRFEDKLSEALTLIEKLARSQERMEHELIALRKGDTSEFKLEPSAPKP
jgi:hypothetical protein